MRADQLMDQRCCVYNLKNTFSEASPLENSTLVEKRSVICCLLAVGDKLANIHSRMS